MTEALRLTSHPVLDISIENRRTVTITVDGKSLDVIEGEILAAALWANGYNSLGHNPNADCPRGMYCGIGHCYECRVTVDGVEDVRSCLTPVREGMRIFLQRSENKTGSGNGD
jgi:sarcosine oxidase subunit alpha